jgi:hypothetical protein
MEGGQSMSLANDVGGEIKAAKKLRLPWWGVLCGIIGSFLCAWLFDDVSPFLPMRSSVLFPSVGTEARGSPQTQQGRPERDGLRRLALHDER